MNRLLAHFIIIVAAKEISAHNPHDDVAHVSFSATIELKVWRSRCPMV
jgi:hypothetical protein